MTLSTSPHVVHTPLILAVDDDATMRILLKAALENDGYQVAVATSGEQGLANYLNCFPDMVLLDAMMDTMTGFEVCQQIRQHPLGQTVPILILTSLDDQTSIDQAFAAGATDYITKPVHWAVLSKRVQRLLEQAQIQRMHNTCANEISRVRAWSRVLEKLVLSKIEQDLVLTVFESLIPEIKAAFSLEQALLILPSNYPRLKAVKSHSFVQTHEISAQNSAINLKDTQQWTATSKIEITEDLSAFWVASANSDSIPWSAADQKNWNFLALLLRQGLTSFSEEKFLQKIS